MKILDYDGTVRVSEYVKRARQQLAEAKETIRELEERISQGTYHLVTCAEFRELINEALLQEGHVYGVTDYRPEPTSQSSVTTLMLRPEKDWKLATINCLAMSSSTYDRNNCRMEIAGIKYRVRFEVDVVGKPYGLITQLQVLSVIPKSLLFPFDALNFNVYYGVTSFTQKHLGDKYKYHSVAMGTSLNQSKYATYRFDNEYSSFQAYIKSNISHIPKLAELTALNIRFDLKAIADMKYTLIDYPDQFYVSNLEEDAAYRGLQVGDYVFMNDYDSSHFYPRLGSPMPSTHKYKDYLKITISDFPSQTNSIKYTHKKTGVRHELRALMVGNLAIQVDETPIGGVDGITCLKDPTKLSPKWSDVKVEHIFDAGKSGRPSDPAAIADKVTFGVNYIVVKWVDYSGTRYGLFTVSKEKIQGTADQYELIWKFITSSDPSYVQYSRSETGDFLKISKIDRLNIQEKYVYPSNKATYIQGVKDNITKYLMEGLTDLPKMLNAPGIYWPEFGWKKGYDIQSGGLIIMRPGNEFNGCYFEQGHDAVFPVAPEACNLYAAVSATKQITESEAQLRAVLVGGRTNMPEFEVTDMALYAYENYPNDGLVVSSETSIYKVDFGTWPVETSPGKFDDVSGYIIYRSPIDQAPIKIEVKTKP